MRFGLPARLGFVALLSLLLVSLPLLDPPASGSAARAAATADGVRPTLTFTPTPPRHHRPHGRGRPRLR